MTTRTAETTIPYPVFSISEMPVILRIVNDHSAALRKQTFASRLGGINRIGFGRSKPLPYNKLHLLRIWLTFIWISQGRVKTLPYNINYFITGFNARSRIPFIAAMAMP